MGPKYLYEVKEPAHELADRIYELTEGDYSPVGTVAKEAAAKLLEQQNEIGQIMNQLLNEKPVEAVVEMLLRAGMDRSELLFSWGVPQNILETAAGKINTRPYTV